jgi:hypothetical protein
MLDRLIKLLDILIERLPHISRWENVGIYFPGDTFPKDTITERDIIHGYFYILWYSPRRKGSPNPYEYKEIPLKKDDIDAVIKRQREKLRTESENL